MNAITTRSENPLVQFREELEQRSNELKMALPAHISPAKFQRTVTTAIQQNPGLLQANRRSLILACMKAAQDGLLPDGREAALVEFQTSKKTPDGWVKVKEVAFIPMVYGVRKKVLQARDATGKPVVSALEVGIVYRKEVEAGHFLYEVGIEPPLRHRPMLDLTMEETTDDQVVGAYSIATMADGTKSYEFMRRFEIDRVRETSQTGATKDRQGKPRQPKGPWADHFPEMAKKTVLRRHAKSLPQSGDLILEEDDDEFDHGASAALTLGRGQEDAPTLITDDSGSSYDRDTGEVLDQGSAEHNDDQQNTQGESGTSREDPGASSSGDATSATGGSPSEERTEDDGPPQAAKDKAEEIIGALNSAKSKKALQTIMGSYELDITALPEELSELVDNAWTAALKRLDAKQPEPAQ